MHPQVRRIGDPLVWRHAWDEKQGKVIHQYKYALSDEATFLRDEWGPWVEVEVPCNDPYTGAVVNQTVFRTDPSGVALVKSYPRIEDFPGVEEWNELSSWKADHVFDHLQKWKFSDDVQKAARAAWKDLNVWHKAHTSSQDIDIGEPLRLPSASLSTTPIPWTKMWDIILSDVRTESSCKVNQPEPTQDVKKTSMGKRPFLDPLSKKVDREALSKATSLIELNRVTNPNYTMKDQKAAIARDESYGAAYVNDNLQVQGTLFFIKLKHYEGEFAIGLGKRTFNKEVDGEAEGTFEIQWFERKNKKNHSWGKQPGFRVAIQGYSNNRKPIPMTSIESLEDFLPLAIEVTKRSQWSDEPVLSQDTMTALRSRMPSSSNHKSGSADSESSASASSCSDVDDCSSLSEVSVASCKPSKRKRKP